MFSFNQLMVVWILQNIYVYYLIKEISWENWSPARNSGVSEELNFVSGFVPRYSKSLKTFRRLLRSLLKLKTSGCSSHDLFSFKQHQSKLFSPTVFSFVLCSSFRQCTIFRQTFWILNGRKQSSRWDNTLFSNVLKTKGTVCLSMSRH